MRIGCRGKGGRGTGVMGKEKALSNPSKTFCNTPQPPTHHPTSHPPPPLPHPHHSQRSSVYLPRFFTPRCPNQYIILVSSKLSVTISGSFYPHLCLGKMFGSAPPPHVWSAAAAPDQTGGGREQYGFANKRVDAKEDLLWYTPT